MIDLVLARGSSAKTSATWVVLAAFGLALLGVIAQTLVVAPVPRLTPLNERPLRQLVYVLVAAGLGVAAHAIGYRRAVQWSRPLLWVTWALLGVLLVPGMPTPKGAARWLDFGAFNVQPSEIAKVVMILFLTRFAVGRAERMATFRDGFLPGLFYMGVTAALIRFEPDLGQTLFVLALSGAVLTVNGVRVKHFLPVFLLVAPLLVYHAVTSDHEGGNYVQDRLQSFLSGGHYQVRQGLGYFGIGGANGTGLAEARAHLFVPEIHNDFVLVSIGESLGFFGSVAVVLLFLALFWHGLRLALLAADRAGFSVAFGVSLMIALQAAVNIAVVTASVPPKGISLPFLSYGGSFLLVLGVAIGLLASVAADARDPAPRGTPIPLSEGAPA